MTSTLTCKLPECESSKYCRGYCIKHYYRIRKHGDPYKVKSRHIDATGTTFTRWKVLERTDKKPGIHYLCQCECGTTKVVNYSSLKDKSSRSCGCLYTRLPPGEAAKNHLMAQYRSGAQRRGLEFNLDRDYFLALTSGLCYYCGSPPLKKWKAQHSKGEYPYNGLDRIDNSLGYVENNVVSCCYICNHAKKDMSQEDFLVWIDGLIRFRTM